MLDLLRNSNDHRSGCYAYLGAILNFNFPGAETESWALCCSFSVLNDQPRASSRSIKINQNQQHLGSLHAFSRILDLDLSFEDQTREPLRNRQDELPEEAVGPCKPGSREPAGVVLPEGFVHETRRVRAVLQRFEAP